MLYLANFASKTRANPYKLLININLNKKNMNIKYKINWYFNTVKETEKAIEALGAKSLDFIKFYDDSNKLVEIYSSMHTVPHGVADSRTKIEIANQFKNGASYCIFVRS